MELWNVFLHQMNLENAKKHHFLLNVMVVRYSLSLIYSSAPSYRQCYWILRFLKEFRKVPFMHILPKNIMHCLWVEFIYSPYIHIQFTIQKQKHNIETYLGIHLLLFAHIIEVCLYYTLILWWNFFWIPSEPYKLPSCSPDYKTARLAQSVLGRAWDS